MTDEFEKWMKEYGSDVYYRIGDMQAAYSAGASAMREKCKEQLRIADEDVRQHSICQTCYAEEKLAGAISSIERVEI